MTLPHRVLASPLPSLPLWCPGYEFDRLTTEAWDAEMVLALAREWPRGLKYKAELEAAIVGGQHE